MPPAEVLALLAASLFGAALLRRRRLRDRSRRLDPWARTHGLSPTPGNARNLTRRYAGLRLMHAGHNRQVTDAMHLTTPAGRLVVFTVTCEIGLATDRRLLRRSVALLETTVDLPGLYSSRRQPLEPVGGFSGYRRLRLPNADAGQPHLHVETPWGPALDDGLADWLAGQPPDRTVECRGRFVAVYEPASDDPDTLTPLLAAAPALAERLLTGLSHGSRREDTRPS